MDIEESKVILTLSSSLLHSEKSLRREGSSLWEAPPTQAGTLVHIGTGAHTELWESSWAICVFIPEDMQKYIGESNSTRGKTLSTGTFIYNVTLGQSPSF